MFSYHTLEDNIPVDLRNADYLGGKGFGLYKMRNAGVPVPPAIIIPTAACIAYRDDPKAVMEWVLLDVLPAIEDYFMEPLGYLPLLSVRSGAKFSMPGMMDTILNVGLNPLNYPLWKARLGLECMLDCRKRLITMYADVVLGKRYADYDLGGAPEQVFWTMSGGQEFPAPRLQLLNSIEAVFRSWDNERAVIYRDLNKIDHDLGTAVIIQQMVFGNLNENSYTGVVFSRCPSTGAPAMTGEFLQNAQGEDVVAGGRTPLPIGELEKLDPDLYAALEAHVVALEETNRDMQDVEFTVEDGKLWILQTRNGKRSTQAAVVIACGMLEDELITYTELKSRVTLKQYLALNQPRLDPDFDVVPSGIGIGASTGVVVGRAVFSSKAAVASKDPCILIAKETTPDDIAGINAAVGILTAKGGATSHAAVVARGMGKVCVVGATGLLIGPTTVSSGEVLIGEGDWVTIDGSTGRYWLGVRAALVEGSAKIARRFEETILRQLEVKDVIITHPDTLSAGVVRVQQFIKDHGVVAMEALIAKMSGGVLDCRPIDAVAETEATQGLAVYEANALIGSMFGGPDKGIPWKTLYSILDSVKLKPKAEITVMYTENVTVPPQYRGVAVVTTLSELIYSKGYITPSFDLDQQALDKGALDRLIDLKANAGEPVKFILGKGAPIHGAMTALQHVQGALA